MPWHIAVPFTLFLFALAPFFRKWVDIVVWPRIANWWATRSLLKLQTRILVLEEDLRLMKACQPLTPFEVLVLAAIKSILWSLLSGFPCAGLILYLVLNDFPSYSPSQLSVLFLVVLSNIGYYRIETVIDRFMTSRSSDALIQVEKSLNELRQQFGRVIEKGPG
jgi:hypothetical protein